MRALSYEDPNVRPEHKKPDAHCGTRRGNDELGTRRRRKVTMDPLTISTGVLACISISLKVLVGLKQLKANVGVGGGTIGGASIEVLAGDISGLRMVLQRMEEAFQDADEVDEADAPRETGERGAHRRDLRRCLSDGYRVLSDFDLMVLDLNKRVKVHALSRLQSRLASAAARFLLVGQQVRAWKTVFQISLEAMKPALGVEPMLTDEFHRLVARLDMEIQTLEDSTTTGQADAKMVETIAELKRCVVSAMSVFSAPTLTEESRAAEPRATESSLLTNDGAMDWTEDGSADGDRWQTSTPDDYGLESASPKASTTLPMPAEEEAMRPTAPAAPPTLTAPPTPTARSPFHTDSPAEASGYPHISGHTGHRHPLHTSPTHPHWPPGPVIMYMAPVSRNGKDQKEPNTSMSSAFPVQVIFGPPPAPGHPPMTLQHLVTPPRSAGLPSSPATTHSRQSTTSSVPSIPSIVPPQHRSLLPQYHPQDVLLRHKKPPPPQPALRSPPPEVQRKQRPSRTRQLPQPPTQARSPQPPPPKPHRGSELPTAAAAAAKHAGDTSTARKKQLRFMPGINPEEVRRQPDGHRQPSTAAAAAQKRKSPNPNPFTGWKRLLPSSSSGRQNPPLPRRRQKLCFVGDRGCGKTCLLR